MNSTFTIDQRTYDRYINFAKQNLRDKHIANDVVHDILLQNGTKVNSSNFKGFILFEIKKHYAFVKHEQIGIKHNKPILMTFVCKDCKSNLPESEFKRAISSQGKIINSLYCNECRLRKKREQDALYRKKDHVKELKRLSSIRYRLKNREKVYCGIKKYRVKNRQKVRKWNKLYKIRSGYSSDKRYYKKNRERICVYKKGWYEKNKERILKKQKQRYKNRKNTIILNPDNRYIVP